MRGIFRKIAHRTAELTGSARMFMLALLIIIVWLVTGPLFDFSDTWQLVINTATTIITFLMVFLIQNTQNRDSKALHLKLDELIKSSRGASNKMIDLEEMTDEELDALEVQFRAYRARMGK